MAAHVEAQLSAPPRMMAAYQAAALSEVLRSALVRRAGLTQLAELSVQSA